MPATYERIASITLSSSSATITFNSIPSTYTDLRLVLVNLMSNNGGNGIRMRYNSDSSALYSYTELGGYGTAISTRAANQTGAIVNILGSGFIGSPVNINFDIFSYAGSTFKSMLAFTSGDGGTSGGSVDTAVTLWRSTSAITSITLSSVDAYTFTSGTTATIYGIKAA